LGSSNHMYTNVYMYICLCVDQPPEENSAQLEAKAKYAAIR